MPDCSEEQSIQRGKDVAAQGLTSDEWKVLRWAAGVGMNPERYEAAFRSLVAKGCIDEHDGLHLRAGMHAHFFILEAERVAKDPTDG